MMDDKYPASSLALMGTVLLFKEDLSLVVGGHGHSVPEPAMSPVFLKHEVTDEHFLDASKFDVYVDGMKVVECNDFVEAMMVYTCMFYVFNLVHPKALIKTLLFFHKAILKLEYAYERLMRQDRENARKVISVLAHLNSLRSDALSKPPSKKQKLWKTKHFAINHWRRPNDRILFCDSS